ncbi:MAG: response regulator [Magnetococcales bacterium]|nr:response regulator [Magnetococcales bacterium]
MAKKPKKLLKKQNKLEHRSQTSDRMTILIVDDVPANIKTFAAYLSDDYEIIMATSGHEALKMIASEQPDLVLLDVVMPEMDGFTVCERIKADPRTESIPIIFLSARSSAEALAKGLELGAHYYLTKPAEPDVLRAVITQVLQEAQAYAKLREEMALASSTISLLTQGTFHFHTIEEAHRLAVLVSKACPNPKNQLFGLKELMVNAVEHGNLGISYEEKGRLLAMGLWEEEINRRLQDSTYGNRQATLTFTQDPTAVTIVIKDEGSGFAWKPYLEISPERLFDTHGRGIAMSRNASFDTLEFQGCGNQVQLIIYK